MYGEIPTGWQTCSACGKRFLISEMRFWEKDIEHDVSCPYCHKDKWIVPKGTRDYFAITEEEHERRMAYEATLPRCPSCGAKMTKRENSKNGNSFWGCSAFPKCKQTMPID